MYALIFILGTFLGGVFALFIFCIFAINRTENEAERRFTEEHRQTEGGHSESSK